jgi:hypothetical protein
MLQRHRNTEIRRGGEAGRSGDKEIRCHSTFLLVLLSPCLLVFLSLSPWLCGSVAGQTGSLEKQAISSAQEMSASDLDATLPDRPFAGWFTEVIGPKAGVVWQLTECGERIAASGEAGHDLPACAEVNASLPGGRKVFVVISVGTFKKGLAGKPSFFRAVIEHNERFYQVRRLSELPQRLRAPEGPSTTSAKTGAKTGAKKRITNLPTVKMDSAWALTPFRYLGPMFASVPPVTDDLAPAEEPSTPPAPPPPASTSSTQDFEQVPESELQSRAITRIKPEYPPTAKKMRATGPVEVDVTISGLGLVIKPAMLNGAPVRVKSVLTFVFAPSAQ